MAQKDRDVQLVVDLLSRGWDGRLTDEDNAKLNAILEEGGAESAEVLLKASSVHLELNKHVASAELLKRTIAAVHEAAAREESAELAQPSTAVPSALRTVNSRYWFGAAVAALLLAALCLQFAGHRSPTAQGPEKERVARLFRPSKPVASVVTVTQAVWAEGSQTEVGNTVHENQRVELVSGMAQLSMACGADLVLQGPCSVTLIADDFAKLESGKLTAQVAEWVDGFTVATNGLKVIDLGTRFALSADNEGVVEAHVLDGSVLAEPLRETRSQQSSMLLTSGQAIRVDGVRSKIDLIEARRNDFVDELSQFRPLRPIRIWNTGVGAALGADDPHWHIVSGAKEHGPYPRKATITEGDTRSYEDNKPGVSQWISVTEEGYPGVPPESVHRFETRFDLTGFDPSTVYIVGYFLVDDAINELRINGHPVEFERWVTTWDVFDFRSFHPIEIDNHFVSGENVITIDVYNSPSRPENPTAPNPTALRVEWQAFGSPVKL